MIIKDVLCPFCGCLCDDLAVEVEDNKVVDVKHACKIGASKIMGHDRIKAPMMRDDKNGEFREVSYDEAINESAKILANSKRPLLYGWASG
ncbi:MAG: formylmethanofuran dehydrogenase subunit B, partial [ANME-2 cluster archaeon]|nr:formylmethanofuran dehydrogenase subunit B [ANME-2 cluster archaeon]